MPRCCVCYRRSNEHFILVFGYACRGFEPTVVYVVRQIQVEFSGSGDKIAVKAQIIIIVGYDMGWRMQKSAPQKHDGYSGQCCEQKFGVLFHGQTKVCFSTRYKSL